MIPYLTDKRTVEFKCSDDVFQRERAGMQVSSVLFIDTSGQKYKCVPVQGACDV